MAGIYIHIPFCKKACHYCNFHFSTSLASKNELISCLLKELENSRDYLNGELIETIYFGGGTPSLLEQSELMRIFDSIHKHYNLANDIECTLEANPDDLSYSKLKELATTPVNRFSIGVQSFFDDDLKYMNRSHDSSQAIRSIKTAQDVGFENITLDLIFGFPLLTTEKLKSNIHSILELQVPHVSTYAMTVEPNTALDTFIKKKAQEPINHEQAASHYEYIMNTLLEHGFEHYEISSFAKELFRSKHNSNYWNGISYLGIGPSAHSFNGISRQWNVANNAKYIKAIHEQMPTFELEILSRKDIANEFIMTRLRTKEGINRKELSEKLSSDEMNSIMNKLEQYQVNQMIDMNSASIKLTTKGKFFADRIASDLFLD